MKIYCVYFHINPVKQEIFYVGIGKEERAYKTQGRSEWWHKVVKKYDYNIILIHCNLPWSKAQKLERKYIKQIGRRNLGKGPLVNLTDGGEGVAGLVRKPLSDEVKKKMSLAQKLANKTLNRKHTEETKKKIGLANKGKVHKPRTPEEREKLSIFHKARVRKPYSEEAKLKMSQSQRLRRIQEQKDKIGIFIDIDDTSFVLPDKGSRLEIIAT